MPGRERIDACLAAMGRRGPDDAASRAWSPAADRHVLLLHTRLAIVDRLARANQPLRVGAKWIASNSELYNYRELRTELSAAGRSFVTSSDTEVLLHAIDTWGWAALDRCEGMWAFAVYDEDDGSLVLARDRFGEKPLWLWREGDDLYFGSEVKFLAALSGRRPRANLQHLRRYLMHGHRALYKTGDTFHEGVEALPPATLLRLDMLAPEKRHTYWAPRFAPEAGMTYDEAVAGTRERLRRAVELRLRADVPAAFCLSGGVDSNAIAAIARRELDYVVHAFTALLDDPRYDERVAVDAAVAALGVRHEYVRPERARFLNRLRELVAQHDGPLATISYFVHWSIMEAQAAAGYRVSISGTGADELFAGYYDHHLAYLHELRADPAARATAEAAWRRRVFPHVRNPALRDPGLFDANPADRRHLFGDGGRFAELLHDGSEEPFSERRWTDDLLRNRMLNELTTEVVPVILHEDDLNAMYFSVENRAPFLDRDLVEFAYRIPTRALFRDGFGKAVLRDAVRGIVPDLVLDEPRKVGFNAPIEELLDLHAPDIRAEVLRDGPLFDLVRRERLEALLARDTFDNSESKFIFNVVNTKLFLEQV
jgi:asparagine synthase (glutamine-hydrolysing)